MFLEVLGRLLTYSVSVPMLFVMWDGFLVLSLGLSLVLVLVLVLGSCLGPGS